MKNIIVTPSITIKEAMKTLDITAKKCLLVIDSKNILLGTLTDGDVRRSILSGVKISDKILGLYKKKPFFLTEGKYTKNEAEHLLLEKKIDVIPIINEKKELVDYLTWFSLNKEPKIKKTLENIPIVIMAGGKGTRLEPFTQILPKPLIPVHEKPIIIHIIERFTALGSSDFFITVNYKSSILKAYFKDLKPDYNIHFVDESKPLGTAGSLYYLKRSIDKPFFVTNCDIIVKADYSSFYNFHIDGDYDISLVASTKEYIIPYGTCELDKKGDLYQINEKPQFDFLINTGLYIINPEILNLIPKNTFFHITHLIELAKKNGKSIGVFPVNDDAWIDIGEWAEYKKAIDLL